jgi:hypothetical protein
VFLYSIGLKPTTGVSKKAWAFKAVLAVPEELRNLAHMAVLEFESVDTFASIYMVSFIVILPIVHSELNDAEWERDPPGGQPLRDPPNRDPAYRLACVKRAGIDLSSGRGISKCLV